MAKPESDGVDLVTEYRMALAAAFGAMFEVEDRVEIHTHSGGVFAGEVEDCNFSGIVIRLWPAEGAKRGRLFFVSFSGIEHSEIFEDEDPDDGAEETDDGQQTAVTAPAGAEGAAVTPITSRTEAA